VATVLDYLRRKRVLHDPEREIFSKYWMDGDLEVQQGYLPQLGAPVGTKLRRGLNEKPQLVTQWLSQGGDTTLRQLAKKWGVAAGDVEPFLGGLFAALWEKRLLVPVQLKGSRGRPLPDVSESISQCRQRAPLRRAWGLAVQELSPPVPASHAEDGVSVVAL